MKMLITMSVFTVNAEVQAPIRLTSDEGVKHSNAIVFFKFSRKLDRRMNGVQMVGEILNFRPFEDRHGIIDIPTVERQWVVERRQLSPQNDPCKAGPHSPNLPKGPLKNGLKMFFVCFFFWGGERG